MDKLKASKKTIRRQDREAHTQRESEIKKKKRWKKMKDRKKFNIRAQCKSDNVESSVALEVFRECMWKIGAGKMR